MLIQKGEGEEKHPLGVLLLAGLACAQEGTMAPPPVTTAPVACSVAQNLPSPSLVGMENTITVQCNTTHRRMRGNGIPDHAIGTFPNAGNPNTVQAQQVSLDFPFVAQWIGGEGVPSTVLGYARNGVIPR